jgi:hypothetical protein
MAPRNGVKRRKAGASSQAFGLADRVSQLDEKARRRAGAAHVAAGLYMREDSNLIGECSIPNDGLPLCRFASA